MSYTAKIEKVICKTDDVREYVSNAAYLELMKKCSERVYRIRR